MDTVEVRLQGHKRRMLAFTVVSTILILVGGTAHLFQVPPLDEAWSAALAGFGISLMFVAVASFGHTPERLLEIGDDGIRALSGAHFDQDAVFPWAEVISVAARNEERLEIKLRDGQRYADRQGRLFGEDSRLLAENRVVIHYGRTEPPLSEVERLCRTFVTTG